MSSKRPERRGKSPRRKRSGSSAAVKPTKLNLDDLFAPSGEPRRPKTVPRAVVELAASWAEAMLGGKFDEAAQYLADDCTCVWDDGCVEGPGGITQRYRRYAANPGSWRVSLGWPSSCSREVLWSA